MSADLSRSWLVDDDRLFDCSTLSCVGDVSSLFTLLSHLVCSCLQQSVLSPIHCPPLLLSVNAPIVVSVPERTTMMPRLSPLLCAVLASALVLLAVAPLPADAFVSIASSSSGSSRGLCFGRDALPRRTSSAAVVHRPLLSSPTRLRAVADVGSEDAFDKVVKSAGDKLVVVDYSTTWCGPCKVIAPKFEEFSDKYANAVFLKVIGDASPEASKLMKREGVRSVPSFHYFVKGEKVEVVNGANAEAIEAAITKHLSA